MITYNLINTINPKLIRELKIPINYKATPTEFVNTYINIVTFKRSILDLLVKSNIWNDKQLRQFACWCARRHWDSLDVQHKRCITVAEEFIIDKITQEQMTAVKAFTARNNDISKPKSEANVSARACCTIDAMQCANRSALASIVYSNNKIAMNKVINYLINNI
jgi:hypothetical protein